MKWFSVKMILPPKNEPVLMMDEQDELYYVEYFGETADRPWYSRGRDGSWETKYPPAKYWTHFERPSKANIVKAKDHFLGENI